MNVGGGRLIGTNHTGRLTDRQVVDGDLLQDALGVDDEEAAQRDADVLDEHAYKQ